VFNCGAPDTGNMEVLLRYGSPEQRERWLDPLLRGEIRSGFAMTEPDVASSDATNMQATARVEGDSVVLDGRKWWTTGLGHPHCRFVIFMGLSDASAEPHRRHSMVICPLDAPGVQIERMLPVFHHYDEPSGHGQMRFEQVRLPLSHVILGPGRGFEIAQGRLGPGRVHHCMRALGAAERALTLLCRRASARVAFGQPLLTLGGNADIVANLRMAIEQARLLTLKTAWTLDTHGTKAALSLISQIKVVVPAVAQQAADAAIQIHGGAGLTDDFPLAQLYAYARVLRLADGPDEVHRAVVAKLEARAQLAAENHA
jgi:alkylation response protein AidB-like acyl-CoA dehydrogenase